MRYWIYLLIIFISAYVLDYVFKYGLTQTGVNIIIMTIAIILYEVVKISKQINKKITIKIHVNKDNGKEVKGNG